MRHRHRVEEQAERGTRTEAEGRDQASAEEDDDGRAPGGELRCCGWNRHGISGRTRARTWRGNIGPRSAAPKQFFLIPSATGAQQPLQRGLARKGAKCYI